MAQRKDPLHPIVDKPWSYEIVGFNYQRGDSDQESFVDITLAQGEVRRHLRFLSPTHICIDGGFPAMSGGLVILDISGRSVAGVAVMVEDFESDKGSVRFYARKAIDLDESLFEPTVNAPRKDVD